MVVGGPQTDTEAIETFSSELAVRVEPVDVQRHFVRKTHRDLGAQITAASAAAAAPVATTTLIGGGVLTAAPAAAASE